MEYEPEGTFCPNARRRTPHQLVDLISLRDFLSYLPPSAEAFLQLCLEFREAGRMWAFDVLVGTDEEFA